MKINSTRVIFKIVNNLPSSHKTPYPILQIPENPHSMATIHFDTSIASRDYSFPSLEHH